MNAIFVAVVEAAAVLGGAPTVEVELEFASPRVHRLDPVFVCATARNTGGQAVDVSVDIFQTVHFSLKGMVMAGPTYYVCRYSYFRAVLGGDGAPRIHWKERERKILDYRILELPPSDQLDNPIMQSIIRPDGIVTITAAPDVFVSKATPAMFAPGEEDLKIRPRPKAEAELLDRVFAESQGESGGTNGRENMDCFASHPSDFGLVSTARWHKDSVKELLASEQRLSPGGLRDILHLTLAMQSLYDSEETRRQREIVANTLAWLDQLPEIERRCLAITTLRWANRCPDERKYYPLVHGLIERLPQKLYEHDDYRSYLTAEYRNGHRRFEPVPKVQKMLNAIKENKYSTEQSPPPNERRPEPCDPFEPFPMR